VLTGSGADAVLTGSGADAVLTGSGADAVLTGSGADAVLTGSAESALGEHDLRPLGQAPLLDSEPLPATRPGMLRPRPAEGFSLPAQRPAFDVGPETAAELT
jgi:hypothetical protein